MASVSRFEDLIAWQRAKAFSVAVYGFTKQYPFSRDAALCSQIRRAAVSIMSNLAEGFEHTSHAEFLRFVNIAKASAAEVRSQIYLAHEIGYLDATTFQTSLQQIHELGRIIGGLRAALYRQTKAQAVR